MSQIFDNLWICGVDDVYRPSFIKSVIPTHIINCTVNERMYYGEIFCERLRIPLRDDHEDDVKLIIEGADKLNEMINKPNSKVIVHCAVGMSRSVTVVLAWMIIHKKYKFDKAYDYVAEKRPIMRPNNFYRNFLKSL
jgi:hypothetical protein